jgi:hypothetical protein
VHGDLGGVGSALGVWEVGSTCEVWVEKSYINSEKVSKKTHRLRINTRFDLREEGGAGGRRLAYN